MNVSFESTLIGSALKELPVLVYIRAWKLTTNDNMSRFVFFQGVSDGPHGRRLQLRAADSTWRQELHYQRDRFLKDYCKACRSLGMHESLHPVECIIVM